MPHKDSRIILPSAANSEIGGGRIAEVDSATPITLTDAIERVKKHTGIKTVQVAIGVDSSLDSVINSFGVCPGAGSSVLKGVKVDLFISGDFKKLFIFGLKYPTNPYRTQNFEYSSEIS